MSNEQQAPKLSRRQRAKARREQEGSVESKSLFMGIASSSAVSVDFFQQIINTYQSDAKVLELIERNATVSTAIDLLATIVSTMELNLYRRQKTGDFTPIRGIRHIDHILSKPNQNNTKTTFLYDIVQNLLAFGHVYVVQAGKEYHVFQPREITPTIRDGVIVAYNIPSIDKDVAPAKVLHIFRQGLNRRVYASPVKQVIAQALLNTDIMKQVTNHVKSGMMAKGVLKQDGTNPLSQAAMEALSKMFTEATQGDRAKGTIMLPKGVSYEAFAATVADSALVELLGITEKQIIQAFRIPESVFTAEATSFASANVQEVFFMKNGVRPICTLIQDAFNGWSALTSETEYFQFEMGDLVSQEEEKFKAETDNLKATTATTLNSLKLYSPNEIREASGHGKITDDAGALVDTADDNPFNADPVEGETDPNAEVPEEELDGKEDDVIKSLETKSNG